MTAATPLILAGMIILTALMMIAVAVSTLDNIATRRSNRRTRDLCNATFALAEGIDEGVARLRDLAAKIQADIDRRRPSTIIWEEPSV